MDNLDKIIDRILKDSEYIPFKEFLLSYIYTVYDVSKADNEFGFMLKRKPNYEELMTKYRKYSTEDFGYSNTLIDTYMYDDNGMIELISKSLYE